MAQIKKYLGSIVKNPSKANRKAAFAGLQRLLYINEGNHLFVDEKNMIVYLGKDDRRP